jgi:hypothetical protein
MSLEDAKLRDARIKNIGGKTVFLPGPKIEIKPGETKIWPDVNAYDLQAEKVLQEYIAQGVLRIEEEEPTDRRDVSRG